VVQTLERLEVSISTRMTLSRCHITSVPPYLTTAILIPPKYVAFAFYYLNNKANVFKRSTFLSEEVKETTRKKLC